MANATKSIQGELAALQLADAMIRLGARMQPIKELTRLSTDRISSLYREIVGAPPPKGMLPYSLDWYTTWKANIHSSLFFSIYQRMRANAERSIRHPFGQIQQTWLLIDAYCLYRENIQAASINGSYREEPELSFTRAWMLLRFVASGQMTTTECESCHGHFLIRGDDHGKNFVCGICSPPPRAGIGAK